MHLVAALYGCHVEKNALGIDMKGLAAKVGQRI